MKKNPSMMSKILDISIQHCTLHIFQIALNNNWVLGSTYIISNSDFEKKNKKKNWTDHIYSTFTVYWGQTLWFGLSPRLAPWPGAKLLKSSLGYWIMNGDRLHNSLTFSSTSTAYFTKRRTPTSTRVNGSRADGSANHGRSCVVNSVNF